MKRVSVMKRVCMTMMLLSVHANAWTTIAEFESAVAEALTNKTGLVEVAFTNQLMYYSQNAGDLNNRLSADLIRGVCEMEQFEQTMDVIHLTNCLTVATNVVHRAEPDSWMRWQARLLEFSTYASLGNMTNAYLVSSNAWHEVQYSNFVDSTNVVSQALKRHFKVDGTTIRESICYAKAMSAALSGRRSEAQVLSLQLPVKYRQNVEEILSGND